MDEVGAIFEAVAAFGDQQNDIECLAAVGCAERNASLYSKSERREWM